MSLLTLPEPANWPAGGRRLLRLTLVLVAFFAVGVFVGTRSVLRGAYLEAFVGVGFLLPLIFALIALQLVSRGHSSLRASHDPRGTMLRPDRTFSSLMLVAFGVVIPVGLVFVVFTLTGDLEMFTSRRARAGAVVLMILAMGTAIASAISAWRRGGVGYVELTPTGIDIANILRTETVTWEGIAAVDDHSESNKKTRKAIVLKLEDGTEKTIDGADFYVPNGVGLYWMVRHYWRHADDRAELTDGRALERLRDGRFDLA
jgi:hypothetical protein